MSNEPSTHKALKRYYLANDIWWALCCAWLYMAISMFFAERGGYVFTNGELLAAAAFSIALSAARFLVVDRLADVYLKLHQKDVERWERWAIKQNER